MNALDLCKQFEGCRLTAYRDLVGVWTIGYGHTGKDVYEGLVWTQQQADDALEHDLDQTGALLDIYSPGLIGAYREALIDFVFNLGIGAYRISTLRQMVNAQNWAAVKTELLKWDHANGQVIPGLLRRRQAEADLIP